MRQIDVHKLADEARFNPFRGQVLLWCALIIIFDGYDLAVAGIAAVWLYSLPGFDAGISLPLVKGFHPSIGWGYVPLAVIFIFVAFLLYYAVLLAHLGFMSLVVRGGAMIP